jgi:hypothetical protein
MSNTRSPFGVRPIRYRSGAPYHGQCNEYVIPAVETGAVYIGDVVKMGAPTSTEDGTRQWAVLATVGENNVGAVIAFLATDRSSTVYRAGSTRRIAKVCDDPDVVFEVQCASVISASFVGSYGDFVTGQGGSTINGISGWQLATMTGPTDIVNAKIIGFSSKPDESSTDTYPVVEIIFSHAEHHFSGDFAS